MATAEALAPRDHNRPDPIAVLRDELEAESQTLLRRRDQLMDARERVPPIDSDDAVKQVSDYIRQISECIKTAEGARVGRKEPFLASGRAVDGFFKGITDPLDKLKSEVQRRLTTYQREKEARERREREERAAEARRQADAAAAAAREAERQMQSERDLKEALVRQQEAERAAADATRAEKEAVAKPADLVRTRGDMGAVATLRSEWTFADLSREEIDLERLRQHLSIDALERAVRSFIKAGGRELRGVRIYEDHKSVVR